MSDLRYTDLRRRRGPGFFLLYANQIVGADHSFCPIFTRATEEVQCLFSKNAPYGNLTDRTTYSEYAWEFLRRNMFYQWAFDARTATTVGRPRKGKLKSSNQVQISHWGYFSPLDPHEFYYGLTDWKPYTERYRADMIWAPMKQLLVEVAEARHNLINPGKYLHPQAQTVKSRRFRLVVSLELAPRFGPACTGIDLHLQIIERELETLASNRGFSKPKRTSKWLLRRLLATIDLLGILQIRHIDKGSLDPSPVDTQTIAKFLIPGAEKDLERSALKKRLDDYRKLAWEYVYRWKSLHLLTFDPPPVFNLSKYAPHKTPVGRKPKS